MASKTKTDPVTNGNGICENGDDKKRPRLSTTTSILQKSATLEIAAKAKRMNAQGLNVISFSAGEPDFDTPQNVKNAGKEAIDFNMTRYTDSSGTPELKRVIRQKFMRENNLHYDENSIIITNGAKYAIYTLLAAITSPGDEIILPTPYWVSYPSLVKLNGGVPVLCHAKEENDFRLTLEDIKPVITEKTKAIIINSPNNPTGAVYTLKDLEEIVNYLAELNIIVISDEIYEKIVYDNIQHISLGSIVKEKCRRNVVVINGVSKAYAMTGWRIGYAAGPRDIIERMKYFLGHTTSNANSIAMHAAVEALSGNQNSVEMMVKKFNRRRQFMFDELNKIPHLSTAYPQGAFYVFTNFKHYLNKKVNEHSISTTIDLANYLLDEAHVAAVPGESFGMPGYIRFSYATSMDNIAEGIDNLKNALADFE
jgi:aspartate aminotransferase